MNAMLWPLYGESAALLVTEEPRPCRGCGEAHAVLVVRLEGTGNVARCAACDGKARAA